MKPRKQTKKQRNYIKKRNEIINNFIKKDVGGKPISAGGFGCVFYPALSCKNKKTKKKFVSKMMLKKYAETEMRIVNNVKKQLTKIPYYGDYFIVKDTYQCTPEPLTKKDKKNFDKKCRPLTRRNITAKNINSNLHKLKIINMPYSGIDMDKYWETWIDLPESKEKKKLFGMTNICLINLLRKGIFVMNKEGLYHLDIKGGNIMHSLTNNNILNVGNVKTRLIDWGLSMKYKNKKNIPIELVDRPFQFNLPYSNILFQSNIQRIIDEYIKTLKGTDSIYYKKHLFQGLSHHIYDSTVSNLGEGHLSYMLQLVDKIYNPYGKNNIMVGKHIICEYIEKILETYMNKDNKLDLLKYLQEVFLNNVDIWGFISCYSNLITENNKHIHIRNILEKIMKDYCFSTEYADKKIPMHKLINDLLHINYYLGVPIRYSNIPDSNIKFIKDKDYI